MSMILPSVLIVINGSRLASIKLLAYLESCIGDVSICLFIKRSLFRTYTILFSF